MDKLWVVSINNRFGYSVLSVHTSENSATIESMKWAHSKVDGPFQPIHETIIPWQQAKDLVAKTT